MLGNGPHFKWTLGNDSKVEGEDTIWSQLMVVTASHYEAVRCAGLKKAAMIILIQRMRLARLGECLRPKTLPSAQCSSFNGKIPTINNRVVITSKKANITSIWTKNRTQKFSELRKQLHSLLQEISHDVKTSSNLKKECSRYNSSLGKPPVM